MPSPPTPRGPPGAKQPHLEEGPRWLFDIVFHTPWWLSTLLGIAAAVAIVLAIRGVRSRGWTVYRDDQLQMLTTAWTVVVMMVTTAGAVNLLDAGYTANVMTGIVLGVVGSQGSLWLLNQPVVDEGVRALGMSVTERLAGAWLATGMMGYLGVRVVAVQGKGTLLPRMRAVLLGIATVFVFYNLTRDEGSELIRADSESELTD